MKTRYSKPFESVEVKIPYSTGMDPYSGLVDFFEAQGLLVKTGNMLKFDMWDGTEIKEFRKNWTNDLLDIVMEEWQRRQEAPADNDDNNINIDDNLVEE
jgi:hypothetical protein